MKIAIIAWGSLVWDPRTLRIEGDWINQGPELKIEFSRVSKDGRLTLVIDPVHGEKVKTYYAQSSRSDLGDAVADLRDREGTVRKRIGFVDILNCSNSKKEFSDQIDVFETVSKWCKQKEYDAAVWTALSSQFREQTNLDFSVENAINHLKRLPLSARENALKYILKAPEEIVTPVRNKLKEVGYDLKRA